MFIGEAPGFESTLYNKPICGPEGRLFDNALRMAGIRREDCAITNVFDFQLGPDNDTGFVCMSTAERKELLDEKEVDSLREWSGLSKLGEYGYLRPEFTPSLHRLSEEISLWQPNLIVPLGGTALWALTGASSILEARGSVGRVSLLAPGTKLLATLHPVHVMHDYRMLPVMVGDLVKATRQAEFPEVRLQRREVFIPESLEDCLEYQRTRMAVMQGPLAFDIETAQGQITCMGFAPSAESSIVIPFLNLATLSHNHWATPQEEAEVWDWIESVMMDPSIEKLAQNGPYDVYWLLDKYGIKVMNYRHDTRLLHHSLYPELPKTLLFMGASYADAPSWKMMRNTKGGEKRDD